MVTVFIATIYGIYRDLSMRVGFVEAHVTSILAISASSTVAARWRLFSFVLPIFSKKVLAKPLQEADIEE
jgi:hypothetical protein